MIDDLVRRLVGVSREDGVSFDPRERHRWGAWVSVVGMAINLALFGIKLAMGLMVGSIALIADAVHTLSDVVSSAGVWIGFQVAKKPNDPKHPFGHGRMESVSAVFVAALLVVTGIEFVRASLGRLFELQPVEWNVMVVVVLGVTIVLKELMGRFTGSLGKLVDSQALKADAFHHRTDALSSLLVVVALLGSPLGVPALDGAMGLVVGGFIIFSGLKVAKEVGDSLLGEAPSRELVSAIRREAAGVPGVWGVHAIMVHNYGHVNFITLHVEVPESLPAQEAHNVVERVQSLVESRFYSPCVAHHDPVILAQELEPVRRWLDKAVQEAMEGLIAYHDLCLGGPEDHKSLGLEVVLAADLSEEERCTRRAKLQDKLLAAFPCFDQVVVRVEPIYHHPCD